MRQFYCRVYTMAVSQSDTRLFPYGEEQREYQHIVAPVFAITQPSPLYVEWDFLFRILLVFLTKHMGQSFRVNSLIGLPHLS